ncbi:MAG: SET domain-containing protein-lysine N-methyltransferase [Burkholderiaceae bacterium]
MPKLIQTRKSPVHGRGVFALVDIPKGTRIIEYKGERISNAEADRRHPTNPDDPFHTFFFSLSDSDECIDANVRGNAARWINHSCAPNCASEEVEDSRGRSHVYIHAIRGIKAGEELNYDYRLGMAGRITKKDKANYACRCGARKCRGTMLLVE